MTPDSTADRIARLVERYAVTQGPAPLGPCGLPPWICGEEDEAERCAGDHHRRAGYYLGPCPQVAREAIRRTVETERRRIQGALDRLGGVPTWDGYRTAGVDGSAAAVRTLRAFAETRRPERGVYLVGTLGTGKTRLLLTAHFARLDAGYPSTYRTTADLRPIFRALASYEREAQREAAATVAALAASPVLLLDDLGDTTGSQGFHQDFAAGLKGLLDSFGGRLVCANNLDREASTRHPDLGPRVVSRLVEGADVVRLAGRDQRLAGVRAAQ